VRDYLNEHVADRVCLDDLVALTGLSRFHLIRQFRRTIGVPPHEYQLMLRVARARALLERGEALADVAANLGFADQSHFGRTFRRMWRVSPGKFRALASHRAIAF
jgi:AraC-like DNA-binding protein